MLFLGLFFIIITYIIIFFYKNYLSINFIKNLTTTNKFKKFFKIKNILKKKLNSKQRDDYNSILEMIEDPLT
jgi:hypothetical protein